MSLVAAAQSDFFSTPVIIIVIFMLIGFGLFVFLRQKKK